MAANGRILIFAGGYTLTFDENDRTHMTKQKLLDSIAMMLGGRSAEEIMLDDITTGASNDIERATKLARKMVAEWGMSSKLGFTNYGGEKDQVFIGRDYQQTKNYSEQTANLIDSEIKRIIDENYKRGVEILQEKRETLERFANILLEKETIYSREVDMIMNGATLEEVTKEIERELADRKKREDLLKEQSEKFEELRVSQLKAQTAEALSKAGVISKEEFETIKKDADEMTKKLADRNAEIVKTLANMYVEDEERNSSTNQDKSDEEKIENAEELKEETLKSTNENEKSSEETKKSEKNEKNNKPKDKENS